MIWYSCYFSFISIACMLKDNLIKKSKLVQTDRLGYWWLVYSVVFINYSCQYGLNIESPAHIRTYSPKKFAQSNLVQTRLSLRPKLTCLLTNIGIVPLLFSLTNFQLTPILSIISPFQKPCGLWSSSWLFNGLYFWLLSVGIN